LTIPNPEWLQDHRFLGQAVLPGVWALEHLARVVGGALPDIALTSCAAVQFDKFLALPSPDIKVVDMVVDLTPSPKGSIEASLSTRHVAAKSGISRMKTHVRACFGPSLDYGAQGPPRLLDDTAKDVFEVPPDRLYAEMVPFGPVFQNIVSPVRLDAHGARAMVSGGDPRSEYASLKLGSPFPLDAAFHAACAWAQRYRGTVAFPVALQQRLIRKLTGFAQHYEAQIRFRGEEENLLLFDLSLNGADGRVCEMVRGLAMRDVSGGKLRPPDWVRIDADTGSPA
jgi:hypothetical protein